MSKTFEDVLCINVNEHTEKKKTGSTELTYLSWAWAWAEFKKIYPDATYEIKTFADENCVQKPYMYDANTGYMVMTSVTVGDLTYEMWLPVMDSSNKAMKSDSYKYVNKKGEFTVDSATMFDVNKAIMRCLTKNLAMFGLGLYIYAGEDLPEEPNDLPESVLKAIADCDTVDKLSVYYKANKDSYGDKLKPIFNKVVSDRKAELSNENN